MAGETTREGLAALREMRRALTRAAAVSGSLALVMVFVIGGTMGGREMQFAQGPYGVDDIVTGSVAGGERYVVRRSVLQPPGSGPCLYFPDGTSRGAC